jgi:hypothetical protein
LVPSWYYLELLGEMLGAYVVLHARAGGVEWPTGAVKRGVGDNFVECGVDSGIRQLGTNNVVNVGCGAGLVVGVEDEEDVSVRQAPAQVSNGALQQLMRVNKVRWVSLLHLTNCTQEEGPPTFSETPPRDNGR